MSIKRNPFKVIISFLITIIASIFGWQPPKSLAVEMKPITEQTVEERLSNVRKQVREEVRSIARESGSSVPPRGNHKLDNSDLEIKKSISQWRDWTNGWRDWTNGWRDWSDRWRDWSDGWRDWIDF